MITTTKLVERIDESGHKVVLPQRIKTMYDEFLKIKPSISIHRAKAFTDVAIENPGMPVAIVKAKGFYRICETLPIYIAKDELIVGHAGGKSRAAIVSPDICWRWLEKELDTVSTRDISPYDLSEDDKKILKEEIFPYWKGRSVDEIVYTELEVLGLLPIAFETGIIDCEVKTTSGGGDLSPGYGNILLKKGYNGIKEDAQNRIKLLDMNIAEDIEKLYFLKAIIIVCDGMLVFSERFAQLAIEESQKENNLQRKKELVELAKVCKHVPANPPRNFWEALQSIWFGQVSIYLEETNAGTSPGRVDQYLFEYFKRDLDNGTLNLEKARELFYCFMVKFNENTWPLSSFASQYFAGYMPFQNIVVGGLTREGIDGTNDLTYMIMDCSKNLRMFQPSLSVRVHKDSPKEFLMAITDVVATGTGFPGINYDEACIDMLLSRGVSREDALDYCIMACTEPHLHGQLIRWASATYVNFAIPIELVLTNGFHRKSGRKVGLETGELEEFDTFEKFEAAVKEQMRYLYNLCTTITIVIEKAHRINLPKPVGSALLEGCIENGKGMMDGGSKYHWGPGIIVVGLADYANSMYSVKKLVYEDKKISLNTLNEALENDFVGYGEVLSLCKNVAKYGNDIEAVDYFAKEIVDYSGSYIMKLHGLMDYLELLTLSVSTNVPQGEAVSALPSGRKAYLPLADGISPSGGTDVNGPTAVIKSIDKIDPVMSSGATLLNMKFDPNLLKTDKDKENFIALIRAHNLLGGSHIQFNCVSKETLLEAQKNPDQYRSLIVRVAGYSAYFTELTKQFQDELIERTTQLTWN